MKKYGIGKKEDHSEATKQAFEEMVDMACKEPDTEVTVFLFDPENQIIVSKETPYILVVIGMIVGFIASKLAGLV